MAAGDPGLVYHSTARHACTCNWSVQRRTRPCTSRQRAWDSRARVVHRREWLSVLDRFWIVPVENRVLTARETLEYGIVLPKKGKKRCGYQDVVQIDNRAKQREPCLNRGHWHPHGSDNSEKMLGWPWFQRFKALQPGLASVASLETHCCPKQSLCQDFKG